MCASDSQIADRTFVESLGQNVLHTWVSAIFLFLWVHQLLRTAFVPYDMYRRRDFSPTAAEAPLAPLPTEEQIDEALVQVPPEDLSDNKMDARGKNILFIKHKEAGSAV